MRWKTIKYIALGLTLALLLLLIWGVAIEPRLVDYRDETAVVPNLSKEWEGKRIALIADFQVGMWLGNEGTVTEIINRIIEERPSAVLIAGDFVYHPTDDDQFKDVEQEDARNYMSEVNESISLLRPMMDAGIPVYAVLGNHDYGMGYPNSVKNEKLARAVLQTLEAAGVQVLQNEAVPLVLRDAANAQNNLPSTASDTSLHIVGIGSRYANSDKPEVALSQVPNDAARIIFMHNPDTFTAFPAHTAPLTLAGHTHGGQVRIPFTEDWSWMALATDEKIQADGWIDGYGQAGNRLYVNRGIGFSSFPVRINCRPELTLFTLRSGNG